MKAKNYVEDVKNIVCNIALITKDDLEGKSKHRYFVDVRRIVMYILHSKLNIMIRHIPRYMNRESAQVVRSAYLSIDEIYKHPEMDLPLARLLIQCLDGVSDIISQYNDEYILTLKDFDERYKAETSKYSIEYIARQTKRLDDIQNDIQNNRCIDEKSSAQFVLQIVSIITGISVEDITSKHRHKNIIFARQLSTYLLREYFHITLVRTGELLKGINYSTCLHSVNVIKNIIKYNEFNPIFYLQVVKATEFIDNYLKGDDV